MSTLRIELLETVNDAYGGAEISPLWQWRGVERVIAVKPPTDIVELMCALHELGHCAFYHTRYTDMSREEIILQEAQAWAYALACVKPKYYAEALDVCMWGMATYFCIYAQVGIDPVPLFIQWMEKIVTTPVVIEE